MSLSDFLKRAFDPIPADPPKLFQQPRCEIPEASDKEMEDIRQTLIKMQEQFIVAPLTPEEKLELELIRKNRKFEREEAKRRIFAGLPTDIREEIIRKLKAELVSKAINDIVGYQPKQSQRETELSRREHASFPFSMFGSMGMAANDMSIKRLPPLEELERIHNDVEFRQTCLEDNEQL